MSVPNTVRVAYQGCCHGDLDKIYAEVKANGGADLLLIGGDFQAVRNRNDMQCLNVPLKFREMKDFHKYYSGESKAEVLTIFVGGNHEASNHLTELFFGGWVAPNIYYLGKSGVLIYRGLRIGGISGIYNERNFRKGYFEAPPYNDSTIRSTYHVRELEVNKLACFSIRPDIMISHDWPRGIERYGDTAALMRVKKHFIEQINSNDLGTPVNEFLLHQLQPRQWLAAHLHVHFEAKVVHCSESVEERKNSDEIDIGLSEQGNIHPPPAPRVTNFISLDKCVNPRRKFLKVMEMEPIEKDISEVQELSYDLEWLAIVKAFHCYLSLTQSYFNKLPEYPEMLRTIEQHRRELIATLNLSPDAKSIPVPNNFIIEAPTSSQPVPSSSLPKGIQPNSQRTAFCNMLNITDPWVDDATPSSDHLVNPDEIII